MDACHEFVGELEGHSVHVCHREHTEHFVTGLEFFAEDMESEVAVAPEGAVGNHDALRVAGGAAGVVEDCHFVGLVLIVVEEFGQEAVGELFAKEPVEVLACKSELVIAADEQAVIGERDDAQQVRHLVSIQIGPNLVAHEEKLRLRVVNDVVNLGGMELVEDGDGDSSVGEDAEEGSSPSAEVASAQGYLVAWLDACLFEEDVELLDDAGYVLVLKGEKSVVRHRIHEPMFLNALPDHLVV